MYIYKLDRHLLEVKIKQVSHFARGKVLDLGAGSYDRYGSFMKSNEYIKMDIEKSENTDIVGSASAIPFPDDTFDTIISTQVFEHIAEPEKAAGEVSRVLKNGGYFLISVPQTNELHSEPSTTGVIHLLGLLNSLNDMGSN